MPSVTYLQATQVAYRTTPEGAIHLTVVMDFFSYCDDFLVGDGQRSRERISFKISHKVATLAKGEIVLKSFTMEWGRWMWKQPIRMLAGEKGE